MQTRNALIIAGSLIYAIGDHFNGDVDAIVIGFSLIISGILIAIIKD